MSDAPIERAVLEDRGVVSVTGAEAGKLLAGLITNDMALLDAAPALYAGLLTPQGKILFDFFVVPAPGGYLLETARARAGDLAKRLVMYKLRAAVDIRDASADFAVAALWGGAPAPADGARVFPDPRLAALGHRLIVDAKAADAALATTGGTPASAGAYHAHRIALGVPEGGRDFAFGDTFPHEALFDQLHGVSFTKGCFVGQEVVSRMQHRASARKRVVMVAADAPLSPERPPVLMGTVEIGRLGSVAGTQGLALLRLDRVAEAQRDGTSLTAGGQALRVAVPPFATFRIEAPHEHA